MIRILTDSMSDICQEEAAAWGLEVLPLSVRFGQEEYLDGVELSREDFFRRMVAADELPKTSQISPERFRDAFERALSDPQDEVVCITGSSKLSGTYQSAVLARSFLEVPERVHLIDSLSASLGEAQLVLAALHMRSTMASGAVLAKKLLEIREHCQLVGQLDELKYLVLGGRLNAAVGAVGSSLHIKLMLRMSDGRLHQAGLCRSHAKVYQWYADQLRACPPDPAYPVIVAGAMCDEETRAVISFIQGSGAAQGAPILQRYVGTVIGTYVGPNMTAMSWIKKA